MSLSFLMLFVVISSVRFDDDFIFDVIGDAKIKSKEISE